jgi:tRNA threonylcarbamoyladenosine biosynthesis protein TsaB
MGEPSLKCAGVSTLLALACNCSEFEGTVAAVMRARPKIVYGGIFASKGGQISRVTDDRVCAEDDFISQLGDGKIMLVGDCAVEIKEKYFPDNPNVRTAVRANILQRASSLCQAVESAPDLITPPSKLEVSYLQPTKAEKVTRRDGQFTP